VEIEVPQILGRVLLGAIVVSSGLPMTLSSPPLRLSREASSAVPCGLMKRQAAFDKGDAGDRGGGLAEQFPAGIHWGSHNDAASVAERRVLWWLPNRSIEVFGGLQCRKKPWFMPASDQS
jgi:hypothetical protein